MSTLTNKEKQEKVSRELDAYIRDLKLKNLLTDKEIDQLLKDARQGKRWLKEKL